MPSGDSVGSFDRCRRLLRVRTCRADGAYMTSLAGEFDLASVEAVKRELRRAEATGAAVIALDLRELAFMDVSGVRVIVMAHRRLGDRLVIVRGPAAVQRVLEICGADERLRMIDMPPPALRSASRRHAVAARVNQATLAAAVRQLREHSGSRPRPRAPNGW
jgi:anti-anti-sigma factor